MNTKKNVMVVDRHLLLKASGSISNSNINDTAVVNVKAEVIFYVYLYIWGHAMCMPIILD